MSPGVARTKKTKPSGLRSACPTLCKKRKGCIQLIRGGYSRAFGLEFGPKEIWQRGFTGHRIRDVEDYEAHREYIHQNPVKRGLVERAEEYRFSSAYPGYKLDERTPAAKAGAA
jgi:hypothetical protein